MEREPTVTVELEWSRPTQTYGELQGYRLRYGVKDQILKEINLQGKFNYDFMTELHEINDSVTLYFQVRTPLHIVLTIWNVASNTNFALPV